MRIGVISDVHGNLVALRAVLGELETDSPDIILHLGDAATGPLWPRETVDLLRARGITSIRGNHDRWLGEPGAHDAMQSVQYSRDELGEERVAFLAALPPSLTTDGDILAIHGTPHSDTNTLLDDHERGVLVPCTTESVRSRVAGVRETLILCGHSHRQGIASVDEHLIVNPGAVGGPRYADNAVPFAAEGGTTHATYAVATRTRGSWRVRISAVPYDWGLVVRRAQDNGRTEWADAFLRRAPAG